MTKRTRWMTLFAAAAVVGAAACRTGEDLAAPPPGGPPFLAIVTSFDAPPGAFLGERYQYRIQATAAGTPIDTIVAAAPQDTVILSVPPADYVVTIAGLPAGCAPRRGTQEAVFIPEDANTGLVRYFIICNPKLAVDLVTDGRIRDTAFVFRLRGPGVDTVGRTNGAERLVFPRAQAGTYRFELADVAPECLVTSPYGDDVPIDVTDEGSTVVSVRVTCSEAVRRPVIQRIASRMLEGAVTVYVEATDPQRDIDRIAWELTDCQGRPLRADGRRVRQNLSVTAPAARDTAILAGVFELDVPSAELLGRCSAVLLFDVDGNSSTYVETLIRLPTESAPVATTFNAMIVEERALVTTLRVDDPQRDQSSVFPVITLRDGVLGQPDGRPDIGVYAPAGYLSPDDIPELRIGSGARIQPFDILALEVYLFDRAGDVRRVRDAELRQ